MAEEKKVLILGIELDANQLLKAAQVARKEIDLLKETQKELESQGKKNTVEYEENAAKLREASASYRQIAKDITNTQKAREQETGSINQLRAQLALSTQRYNEMSAAQRDNTAEGQAYQAGIKALSDSLKRSESAIGDNRREVGNYAEAIRKALADIDALKKEQADLEKQGKTGTAAHTSTALAIRQQTDALSKVTDEYAEYTIVQDKATQSTGAIAKGISGVFQQFNILPQGLQGATNGVNSLSGSLGKLLLNPIVIFITALVGALALLYKAFAATDSGGTELEARFKQLSAIVDVVMQRVAAFAKGLVSLFSGDFASGAKQMGDAFTGIGKQIGEATAAAYEYVLAIDAIEDAQTGFISEQAKIRNEVAKLTALSVDQNKTNAERKQALEKAVELEKGLAAKQIEFAKARYDEEIKNAARTQGVTEKALREFIEADDKKQEVLLANNAKLSQARDNLNNEGQESLENYYAAVINADTAYFEENKKALGKISAFEKDELDKRQKAHEDSQKKKTEATLKQLNDEKAAIEVQIIAQQNNFNAVLNLKIQHLEKEKQIELQAAGLTANQKLLIEEQFIDKSKKLRSDAIKEEAEKQKALLSQRFSELESETERENNLFARKILDRLAIVEEQRASGAISEQEYQQQLLDIEFEASQQKIVNKQLEIADKLIYVKQGSDEELALLAQQKELEVSLTKNAEDRKRDAINKTAKANKINTEAQLKAADDTFGNLASLFEEGTSEYKAFASLQTVASTISGAMGAFARTSEAFPAPLGQALGAIAAAAVSLQGAKAVAKINSLEDGGTIFPKAARGIILGGQPHTRGGTKFWGTDGTRFEAEKGELLAVVNKRSTGMLRSLSNLNQMGGGVSFERGGLTHLADGGFVSRAITSDIQSEQLSSQRILDLIARSPRPVVIVQDVAEGINNASTVAGRAEI